MTMLASTTVTYLHPADRARALQLREERIAQLEYETGYRLDEPRFPSFLTALDEILITAYDAELTGKPLPYRTRRMLAHRARQHNRIERSMRHQTPGVKPRPLLPRA